MPFDQSTISDVSIAQRLGEIHVSWASSSPAGTWYQVYVAGSLAWYGKRTYCDLPSPTGQVRIDVGAVAAGEAATDFSGSLPTAPRSRALLTWDGGAFLDPTGAGDVAGFKVFGASTPGGAIDYSTPLATIPCYTGAGSTRGYGVGGYGSGGYGSPAGSYSWESDPLYSGTWTFAVAAYDYEGDLGTVRTATVTIAVPPREPGAGQSGDRLTYTLQGYGSAGYGTGGYGMPCVALAWLASPG